MIDIPLYQALLLMSAGKAFSMDLRHLTCFRGGAQFWEDVRVAMNEIIRLRESADEADPSDYDLSYLLNLGEELDNIGDMFDLFLEVDGEGMLGRTVRILGGFGVRRHSYPFLALVKKGYNEELVVSALEGKGDIREGMTFKFAPFKYTHQEVSGDIFRFRRPDWEFA
jgi:hypothetical protein